MNDNSPSPLGVLAPVPGEVWPPEDFSSHVNSIPDSLRDPVARYLDNCPIFLAWMGVSYDVIGEKFVVPGGVAISSDGEFYWRYDASEYVRVYGISPPEEAIKLMISRRWIPPQFDDDEFSRTFDVLMDMVGTPY